MLTESEKTWIEMMQQELERAPVRQDAGTLLLGIAINEMYEQGTGRQEIQRLCNRALDQVFRPPAAEAPS